MALSAQATNARSRDLLDQLGTVADNRGLRGLAERLAGLQSWVAADLRNFEREIDALPRGGDLIRSSAGHLLELGGKHLRPMCVVLAAKQGAGFGEAARQLAVAVELVHSATLLHDDVVDNGETRRGSPTSRMIYGNAASIFAGDWLLIEALRRIRSARLPGLLDEMLDIIEEMILAEAVQLANRGRINSSIGDYFKVVEGKTAALFRWAMHAGASAGELDTAECAMLERYGLHLGVAFQAVDDLLDINGNAQLTGKSLFADLREGKMTYPLIIALERDDKLLPLVEECAAVPVDEPLKEATIRSVIDRMDHCGAFDACRDLAHERARQAVDAIAPLADGPAKDALLTVAEATIYRNR
jgi:octaprenyl-diphosphate synthase